MLAIPSFEDHSTVLRDRIVWFDGDCSFLPKSLASLLLKKQLKLTDRVYVTTLTEDVKQFNKLSVDSTLTTKTKLNPINIEWTYPSKYNDINLSDYFLTLFKKRIINNKNLSEDEKEQRLDRVLTEISLIEEKNLIDLFRTAIYIVDTFDEHGVVWGTGRGSSCASYCLYLLGLHEVDSVKYNIDLKEFFRN